MDYGTVELNLKWRHQELNPPKSTSSVREYFKAKLFFNLGVR
jgi:hypothetical protein